MESLREFIEEIKEATGTRDQAIDKLIEKYGDLLIRQKDAMDDDEPHPFLEKFANELLKIVELKAEKERVK